MAIGAQEIDFELSGGAANTDPAESFHDIISGTSIHEFQSTLSLTQTAGSIFLDFTRVGDGVDAHAGKFVLFVGGAANLSASRIVRFDNANGKFTLENPTAAMAQAGEYYRVFDLHSLFHELSAAQCASGHTDYRLVYVRNNSANGGTSVSFYLDRLNPFVGWASCAFEVMARRPANWPEGTLADEETKQSLSAPHAFSDASTFDDINRQPRTAPPVDLAATQFRGCYIERVTGANARRNSNAVALLVHEFTDDAAQQIKTGCLIPFGLVGFTPEITVSRDRGPTLIPAQVNQPYQSAIYVGGGARYTAEVKAQETGLVVPELEVGWQETGDGSLYIPETPLTDDDGLASVTYHGPLPGVLAQESIGIALTTIPALDSDTLDNSSTLQWNAVIAAGDNRLLLIATSISSTSEDPSDLSPYARIVSVTVSGVEAEDAGQIVVGSARLGLWHVLSPAVGTHPIVITYRGVAEHVGGYAWPFSGVDLAHPFDVPTTFQALNEATGSTQTQSITTVTDNALLIDTTIVYYPLTVFSGTPGGGQTNRGNLIVGLLPASSGWGIPTSKVATTAGLHTMTRTGLPAGPQDRLGFILALRPALASATVTARV